MKIKRLFGLLIAVVMIAGTISVVFAAGGAADPTPIISLEDFKAANAAGTLGEMIVAYDNPQDYGNTSDQATVSYDTANDMLLFNTKSNNFLGGVTFANLGSINTSAANWLAGKTLVYEVTLVDVMSVHSVPMFTMIPYATNAQGDAINPNSGANIWWYCKSGISSTNNYPVSTEHTQYEVTGNNSAVGTKMKFKMIQNDHGFHHFYHDGTTWILLDSYNNSDLQNNMGAPYVCMRHGDIYGLSEFMIYETPASENINFKENTTTASVTTVPTEALQESNDKYVISQETFRKANDVASFFPAVGTASANGVVSWQGGMNNTVVSYDKTNDMLIFDTTKNTNIQGNQLQITGFDTSAENAFLGYTIEYELVLVDINSSNPMNQIGIYFDNFTTMENGCAIWWYTKTGNITQGIGNNGFDHVYDISGFKKAEGESVKFKIVCDDFGITSYYDYGEGWEILGMHETEEIPANKGNMWFAFRNGDVYGIKNFAMYENEEAVTTASSTASGTTANSTTSETTLETTTSETTLETTAEPNSGCGSALIPTTAAIVVGVVPAAAVICRKKKD